MSKCVLETKDGKFIRRDCFGRECYGVIRKEAPFSFPIMKEWVLENQKNIVNLKICDGELKPIEYDLLGWQKDLLFYAYNKGKRFYKKLLKLGFRLEADVSFGIGCQIAIDGILPSASPFDLKEVINIVSSVLEEKSFDENLSYQEAYFLRTKANVLNSEEIFNLIWSKKYNSCSCSSWVVNELARRVDTYAFLSDIDRYKLDLESKMM